jgi:hypothetical protein
MTFRCTCQVEDLPTLARNAGAGWSQVQRQYKAGSSLLVLFRIEDDAFSATFPEDAVSALLLELHGPRLRNMKVYGARVCITARPLDFFYVCTLFICHPSDSAVSEDAEIDSRTVATSALAVRRSTVATRACSGITARPGNMLWKRTSQGVTKRCRLFGLTYSIAPSYMSDILERKRQNAGGAGYLRVYCISLDL